MPKTHTETDAETETAAKIRAWISPNGDSEIVHIQCDDLVIEYLRRAAPEIAKAWEEARDVVGFWYI
jgi:hypothetical protein